MMCRVYGNRVRVCKARGGPKMIPAAEAQWNEPHTHVLGQNGRRCLNRLREDEKCPRCGMAMIICRDRCVLKAGG
jgi:hypothetical protein